MIEREFSLAGPGDLPFIAECVRAFRLDDENLEAAQFIILRDAGRVVAFGRVKPYGEGVFELGGVGVLPDERGKGFGEAIVRELIRRFPTDEVWITRSARSCGQVSSPWSCTDRGEIRTHAARSAPWVGAPWSRSDVLRRFRSGRRR